MRGHWSYGTQASVNRRIAGGAKTKTPKFARRLIETRAVRVVMFGSKGKPSSEISGRSDYAHCFRARWPC